MRWIVLSIVVVVIPYTWFNLHYRKPGRAFEPYRDLKRQANVQSLLSAGFRRTTLIAEQPADSLETGRWGETPATVVAVPGGIPPQLKESLIEVPTLPLSIDSVRAAATASTLLPYTIELTCTFPNQRQSLGRAYLYWKESELILIVHCEELQGELTARSAGATLRLTAPGGSIQPGSYTVSAVGVTTTQQWTVTVK